MCNAHLIDGAHWVTWPFYHGISVLTLNQVKRIHVEQRENPIVNRLNKTKVEKFPDLKEEKEARQSELRRRDRDALQAKVSNDPDAYFPQDSNSASILRSLRVTSAFGDAMVSSRRYTP